MSRQVTITSGKRDVLLPNGLRYQAGAVVILSDTEYSMLSATFKASFLSSDTTVTGGPGALLCPVAQYAPGTQTILTTASATMAPVSSGNASTGSFTAPASGNVLVSVTAVIQVSASGDQFSFGLAAHGTLTPMIGSNLTFKAPVTTQPSPYTMVFPVSGLTPGQSYNFDLMFCVNSAGTLSVYAYSQAATSPNLGNTGTGGPIVMTVESV
jgi:hypothetical protein